MKQLDLGSTQIQMVGYVKADQILCSSVGGKSSRIPVGPAEYQGTGGAVFRIGVELPFSPKTKFLLVSLQNGFTAVIHPELLMDIGKGEEARSLGICGYSSGRVLFQHGTFNPDWLSQLGKKEHLEILDGNQVIALRKSKFGDYFAFVARPAKNLNEDELRFAIVLVPLGLLLELVIAGAVIALGRQQRSLPTVMKIALRRKEFYLVYQPIVALETGQWCGAEALLRWKRTAGEHVGPDVFIPAMEDAGMMSEVTDYVIQEALSDWKEAIVIRPEFHLGINFSASDLEDPNLAEHLRVKLESQGIDPSLIMVEATERGFLNVAKGRSTTQELRNLGMSVAIDDFGTGYSSLAYLNALELDYLKIDKGFVDTIGTEAATSDVVLHIISMAHALNLKMIAEGVETEEQAKFLKDHGVQFAQGWYYAKAMSIADLKLGLSQ